jgi:2-keto-4-pentenoate hydratase
MEAQLLERRARLDSGDRHVGWKVGLNDPAVQRQLEISETATGYLLSATRLEPGSSHSLEGGARVGVEPEIAVGVGGDLSEEPGLDEAEAAIASLAPAIEVVDIDLPFEDLRAILARNVFHRGFAVGPAGTAGSPGELEGGNARLLRNGSPEQAAALDEAARELPAIVQHVARLLARFGERLLAGDLIIAGSLTPITWVQPGDRIEVEIEPLGRIALGFA